MYNHYIPQSDGSFRRNSMPESPRRQPPRPTQPNRPTPPPPPPPKPEPEPKSEPCPQPKPEPSPQPKESNQSQSPLSFLRKLLPRDMDSTDMIIIALLLLLSNEDCDDDLYPMLTIALYFLL